MTKLRGWFLCLLVACASQSACERGGATDPPKEVAVREDGAIELNLMSFNIRYENPEDLHTRSWRQRIVGAVRMIRREAPDIIGVQEALHGQAADLWASLPDYEFFGVGRDDGRHGGEYAGIFYRCDRFRADPEDCGTFWLSATPEKEGSLTWGNEIPRVASWLRLIDLATGRGFYVFNTHWDHRSQPSREQAALLIAQRIDSRKRMDEPVALIGDFNSVETNPGIAYLRGERGPLAEWTHGLLETYLTLHPADNNRRTLHFWKDRREGPAKVDHILVSRGAKVESAAIVTKDEPRVSDHYPVVAKVLFPLKP